MVLADNFVTDGQERQTGGQTEAWGKTICLPTLKRGDIITLKLLPTQEKRNTVKPVLSSHSKKTKNWFSRPIIA